jgi:hypothetical protein
LVPNLKLKVESSLSTATKITGEYTLKEFAGAATYDSTSKSTDLSVVALRSGLAVGLSSKLTGAAFSTPHFKAQYNAENYEVGASV